jgi:serine/threonine protein kinase
VALKVLDRAIAARPGFTERFEREARALARLTHPNIVTVHEHGTSGPCNWPVMELVDGASLRRLMRQGRVAPREALAIVVQVCEALQFAHELLDRGRLARDADPRGDRRAPARAAGVARRLRAE